MAKYIFLGFNSLIFLFISLFTADDVTLKHTLPANAQAGTEFIAEFTIAKSVGVQFGKLQVDLPAGFTAEAVDSKGGQFGTNETHAKLLWMQFPADAETTVKIKFKVDQSATSGPRTMNVKFLYVVGNEKKSVEPEAHTINVTGGGEPVAATSTTTTTTNTTTPTNTTSTTQDTSKFSTPEDPGAEVSVTRTITKDEATGNFKAEITIRKDGIKGFAKYSDVIPDGLVPSKGDMTAGGTFKFADKKATIIWATLPKEEVITVTYWLKVTGTFTQNPVINGTFSYLENETTRKVNANESVVPILSDAIATENKTPDVTTNTVAATNTTSTTNTATTTNTVATTQTVSPVDTETTTAGNDQKQTETTEGNGQTVANAAVQFHVQIGAYKNPPEESYFETRFKITDKINSEMHNGLTKFMVGKYSEYKETRDYRETVKQKGVKDAFVIAYNNGRRITVQEALMIVKQKWFR